MLYCCNGTFCTWLNRNVYRLSREFIVLFLIPFFYLLLDKWKFQFVKLATEAVVLYWSVQFSLLTASTSSLYRVYTWKCDSGNVIKFRDVWIAVPHLSIASEIAAENCAFVCTASFFFCVCVSLTKKISISVSPSYFGLTNKMSINFYCSLSLTDARSSCGWRVWVGFWQEFQPTGYPEEGFRNACKCC